LAASLRQKGNSGKPAHFRSLAEACACPGFSVWPQAWQEIWSQAAAADLAGVAGMPETLFQTGLCRGIPCILLPDLEAVDGLADRRREQILTLIRTSPA
jgi:hypothetical protein